MTAEAAVRVATSSHSTARRRERDPTNLRIVTAHPSRSTVSLSAYRESYAAERLYTEGGLWGEICAPSEAPG